MKKRMIAFLCLLSMIMTAVGCSNKGDTEDKTGRYIEETMEEPAIELNEKKLAIIKNEKGQLEYYTKAFGEYYANKIYCYTKNESGYEKTEVTWAKDALAAGGGEIKELILGQDGHYYLLFELYEQSYEQMEAGSFDYTIKSSLFQSSKDLLSCNNVTPTLWDQNVGETFGLKGIMVNNLQVTDQGILLYQVNYDPLICAYSLSEQKIIETEQNQSTNHKYQVIGNTVYYISEDFSEVVGFDYTTLQENRISTDSIDKGAKLQINEEGTIFLLDALGIHRYKKTGTMWETIVDGNIYSMSIPSYSSVEFLHMPGSYDDFLVYYESNIEGRTGILAEYIFDETIPAGFEKEITVYSLWDNATMREAISNYMKKHTNVRINYVVALMEESSATLSDQIRALNTEVLAGNGADIFLLDGLPVESYIEKGVLMEMSDVLNPFFQDNQLLPKISDDFVTEGKVYGMPIRFYVPVYATSEDIKEQTKSTATMAGFASQSDRKLFGSISYRNLLSMFLYTYSAEFMQEDGTIDTQAMKNFLQNIKIISDQIEATNITTTTHEVNISGISSNRSSIQNFISGNELLIVLNDICSTMGYAGNMSNFDTIKACSNEVGGSFFPVNDIYVPNGIVGINKATKEVELAKDFVEELFKDSIQSLELNDGFPVNSDSLKDWMTNEENSEMMSALFITDEMGEEHRISFTAMTPEEKQKVYDMILSLDTPVPNNTTLMDMILEEGVAYLAGEKELEQAALDISTKVNLYLNE